MVDKLEHFQHHPVLYHPTIAYLRPQQGGYYVDCTLGAGGHAEGILRASTPDGVLLGLDVDPQAIELAQARLAPFGSRAIILRASYEHLQKHLEQLGWSGVQGVLLDLGVSSLQLEHPERGFSFRTDAPLDMRFDPLNPIRAADLVNTLSEADLADLLFRFGEEPLARQVAQAIVRARPLESTGQLTNIILQVVERRNQASSSVKSRRHSHIHPATRTFQALRIAVNRELEILQTALPQAVAALAPGGRLAVISFHSLEDRIVKQFFRRESRNCLCPPRQPVCTCGHRASVVEITRKPIRPSAEEVLYNPRSRSARLRVAERLP